ncbi:hypothetical protein [Microvirga splendida]|uniref:DUF2336 domain-containing protein n=1 Tax=Microvirga splendida TaxID=2795727 RepID=A0ABS0Y8F0_9HYPH|nr:hypothetical protein [Microvirga splendida]MBJ6128564.1 hypothetical protein [Microvirga splendida]
MDLFREVKTHAPRSFSGWALSALISHDEAHPGILRFTISASTLRRQAIFSVLAAISHDGIEAVAARLRPLIPNDRRHVSGPLALISSVLMTRRVRDIVHALYGPVEGLVGVLGRLGDKPLRPTTYSTILALLSQPEHRARAKVLRQMEDVSASAPAILLALRPPFLLPNLIDGFRSADQVTEFRAAIDLICRVVPSVTELELAKSLADLGPDGHLDRWTDRWLQKAKRFPLSPPIQDDGEFVVLRSPKAMRDAAARFQNCLETKIGFCIVGRNAYVEYRPEPSVIELIGLNAGHWLLSGIYGPRNLPVNVGTAHAIHRKITAAGILCPARVAHAKPYNAVARLMGLLDFDGLELNALEEDDHSTDGMEAMVEQVMRDFHDFEEA